MVVSEDGRMIEALSVRRLVLIAVLHYQFQNWSEWRCIDREHIGTYRISS
jgi:hypothetical protein